jgi:hypothetical protein
LFGGWSLTGSFTDTWLWSGTQWTQVTSATSPQSHSTNMVFDASLGVAVTANRASTFEWDGTIWRVAGGGLPAWGGTLAYDAARERVTWYGGSDNNGFPLPLGVYDRIGTAWVPRPTATSPPLRTSCVFTYDPETRQIVCFGGRNDNLPTTQIRISDTWLLKPVQPASALVFGSGCAGSGGVPQLRAQNQPWLGDALRLAWGNLPAGGAPVVLAVGTSNQAWSGGPLPQALGGYGMPGCQLLVALDATILTSTSGSSLFTTLPVPANQALAGWSVFLQGFVFDAAANAAGVSTTDGVAAQLGSR